MLQKLAGMLGRIWISFRTRLIKKTISIFPDSASLRRISASNKQIEEGGIPMRRAKYYKNFAGRGIPKSYARQAWKRTTDASEDLMNMPAVDGQPALMAEEDEALGAALVGDCAPSSHNDVFMNVNEDYD